MEGFKKISKFAVLCFNFCSKKIQFAVSLLWCQIYYESLTTHFSVVFSNSKHFHKTLHFKCKYYQFN